MTSASKPPSPPQEGAPLKDNTMLQPQPLSTSSVPTLTTALQQTHREQHQDVSLGLLSALLTNSATQREQTLWKNELSVDPENQALYHTLQQQPALPFPLEAIETRAEVLQHELALSPLPDDFWDTPEPVAAPHAFTEVSEATVMSIPEAESFNVCSTIEEAQAQAAAELGDPIQASTQEAPASGKKQWSTIKAWGSAIAVAAVALLFWQPPRHLGGDIHKADASLPRGIRSKGQYGTKAPDGAPSWSVHDFDIALFLKRQGKIQKITKGWQQRDQDEIRFMYSTPPHQGFALLLFMIDAQANVSWLYPSSGRGGYALKSGQKQFLPGGATIEAPQGTERLYACIYKQALSHQKLRAFFKTKLTTHALSDIRTLPWPCLYQRTWLLRHRSPSP